MLYLFFLPPSDSSALGQEDAPPRQHSKNQQKKSFDQVVISAFASTHDGWSSDEVILNSELNQAFLAACHKQLPDADAADLNWRLMNLRKAGKLKIKSSKRASVSVSDYVHVAEIAARTTQDRNKVSIDQIMASPKMRSQFDEAAKAVDSEVDLYRVRKAAFKLRKTRKLRPELITRIADWGREISILTANQVASNPEKIKPYPGIYIFRDKTGYLYIGQTDDLRERLKSHLDESHNRSLSKYLGSQKLSEISIEIHSFEPDSRAKETMIRRAYESELIASRKPRFNIQP